MTRDAVGQCLKLPKNNCMPLKLITSAKEVISSSMFSVVSVDMITQKVVDEFS